MKRWSETAIRKLAAEKGYELDHPYPGTYYLLKNENGRKFAVINPKFGDLPQFRSLDDVALFLTGSE